MSRIGGVKTKFVDVVVGQGKDRQVLRIELFKFIEEQTELKPEEIKELAETSKIELQLTDHEGEY